MLYLRFAGPSVGDGVDESVRRRRIEHLQEEYDAKAVVEEEKRKLKQKESEEKERKEKIKAWDMGGRTLSDPSPSSSISQTNQGKSIKSWRGEYNPLSGSGGGGGGYRPSKKKPPGGCGGGGCG